MRCESLKDTLESKNWQLIFFLKIGPTPASFLFLFSVFSNKQYNFYNKWMWKNVHPVYGAGIWTYDLSNMSRHP